MSVAPQTAAAPAPPAEAIVDRPLNRAGTLFGILAAVLSLCLGLAGGYAGQQVRNATSAEFETRTETRVTKLEDAFQAKATDDARFQGRTDASLDAIKERLGIQREDMKERSPIKPAYSR